jgi:hypothetical protein
MAEKEGTIWKYCYWLDDQRLQGLKKEMAKKKVEMVCAEKNPCEALKGEIGYAEPRSWDVICKHDAAPWYDASRHAGKNLVVSSFSLGPTYEPFLETTIEPSSFEPESLPSYEEHRHIATDETYLSCQPEGWGKFPEEMGEAIAKGLANLAGEPPKGFTDILYTWTAVHSNFVNPQYRAGEEFMGAPYSITDTTHISSCCVEFFNLIDSREPGLLVRPCIGAVIVKVLEKDRYYLVRLAEKEQAR